MASLWRTGCLNEAGVVVQAEENVAQAHPGGNGGLCPSSNSPVPLLLIQH